MMEADQNGDGKLDFEEFAKMVQNTDIAKQMVSPAKWRTCRPRERELIIAIIYSLQTLEGTAPLFTRTLPILTQR